VPIFPPLPKNAASAAVPSVHSHRAAARIDPGWRG
jgi:hypothetical protein